VSETTFVDRRARALASDPALNIALEASAGTGKTRVLVDRYVRLVEEGTNPRHILAITFTRKAAGEMKTRIVQELRRRSDLWRDIRERLFEIHVTTIDAFCLGLLREFPLEADLDPDLKLLDEVETKRLLEEAIDDALTEARRGGTTDIRFLVARFGEGCGTSSRPDSCARSSCRGTWSASFPRA
jgi:ATP-dependent helicase/nuclease subunit A